MRTIILCILVLCSVLAYSTPIKIIHNGIEGYFLTEEEFTIVLNMMNEWEYYKELNEICTKEHGELLTLLPEAEIRVFFWKVVTFTTVGLAVIIEGIRWYENRE